jgi:hypothetical protein
MIGRSIRSVRICIASGRISALSPRISNRFTTLVPVMLPTASDALPSVAATTPIASSGTLVPIETTVRPITMGPMPNWCAIRDPPLTTNSEPMINAVRPARNHATLVTIRCALRAAYRSGFVRSKHTRIVSYTF